MIASYQTSGSTSCYVIKGYYRHNSPMSFSSSWLLENDTTSKICSYCCIICALFTINHTVYTGSSSVSQCTSRIQSNTTSDVTTAPSFSHFIWSSAHFFFLHFLELFPSPSLFIHHFVSHGRLPSLISSLSVLYSHFIINTDTIRDWSRKILSLKQCFNNNSATWQDVQLLTFIFFITEVLMIRRRDSFCINNSICQCLMWWRPLDAVGWGHYKDEYFVSWIWYHWITSSLHHIDSLTSGCISKMECATGRSQIIFTRSF